MTSERDIELVLDRWFAEGPREMPDQFYLAVVDLIDHTPQRRLVRLKTRFFAMSPAVRYGAAIAAALTIAAAAAFLVVGGRRNESLVPPAPSAVPTQTPIGSPSAAVALPPSGLLHRWNGPPRPVAGMEPPAVTAAVTFVATTMTFDAGGDPRPDLASKAVAAGPGRIELTLRTAQAGCHEGDLGTYSYALSPGGGFVTLTPEADSCPARSQAVAGDWVRSDCPNPGFWCLGDLEAGAHVSAAFDPFVPFKDWSFQYGKFAYTVPDGWANIEEDSTLYVLARQTAGEDASIWLLSDEAAHKTGRGCPDNMVEPGVGRTPQALAAWIPTLPGVIATAPRTVDLGGLTGLTLDVSVKPSWTDICTGESKPSVALFADADGREHDVKVVGDVPIRLYLLDLGDGRTLLVDVVATTRADWQQLVTDATPIIQTFRFDR